MLKRVGETENASPICVTAGEAAFPAPFRSGLEYAPPARGTWNIVHTGMLIPGGHEIFVCAAGCIRGVVLTAAEMGAMDRFSTVTIRENNVLDGDMEELIIDGVTDILGKLPQMPKAVLIYTSCIHHFMACDLERVYRILRTRFPQTRFTDCYMNPIMRKSGLTPDQLMRRQLYSFLEPRTHDPKSVNIIGNDLPTGESSELVKLIKSAGCTLRDITGCKTFDEYMDMSNAFLNISTYPSAAAGGNELEKRLGQKHLYLPVSFDYTEIDGELSLLARELGAVYPGSGSRRDETDAALEKARSAIKGAPVSIDYTAVSRPLQLAKLLYTHGFNVTDIYLDAVTGEDKPSLDWFKANKPSLLLHPTVHPDMRVRPRNAQGTLAIGQKAAYFTGTDRFVNIVEDGGMHGYDGIIRLAGLMTDAWENPKDAKSLITIKGLGCGEGCCL